MTQNHQFAILLPLVVGAGAVACTIFIHALALVAAINFVRYERRAGHAGSGALIDLAIVALGSVARDLWRISRVRNGLLPLSGQLHDAGLWGSAFDTVVAIAGTAGGDERSAHVWCFGGDGLCRYPLALARYEDLSR